MYNLWKEFHKDISFNMHFIMCIGLKGLFYIKLYLNKHMKYHADYNYFPSVSNTIIEMANKTLRSSKGAEVDTSYIHCTVKT